MSTTPQTPTQIRDYWRSLIVNAAALNASLLEWLPPRETDLRKMNPPHTIEPTIGKCRELLDRCCEAERAGQARKVIQRRMDAELWNFMKQLAPSARFPAHARSDIGMTSELFPPHEDTIWPTANP